MVFCLKKPIKYRIGESYIPGAFVNEKWMRSISHILNQSTASNVRYLDKGNSCPKCRPCNLKLMFLQSYRGYQFFSTLIPLYIQIHLYEWDNNCYKQINHKISNYFSHPMLCNLCIAETEKPDESANFQNNIISFEFKWF